MAIRILSSENVKGQLNVKDTQDTVFDSGLSVTRSLTTQTGYINIVGGAFNFNAPASISTKFRSNGNELIRIESDGDFWLRQVGKKLYFQSSAGSSPYIKNSGEDGSTTPYGRNLEFYTDSNKRIEIDYAGTTTFDSGSNNVVAVFKSTDTETQVNFVDSTGFASIRSRNDFRFYVGGSSLIRAMDIADDGNVGIGTVSPDYKLEVQGVISSADAGLQKATFANVGNDLVLTSNADATNVTAKMLFNSSGAGGAGVSTKMIIDGSGNVGIGTVSPSATTRLHIRNATSNSYATLRLEGSNRGGIIQMYNQTSYPVSSIQTDQSGNTYFSTSGAFASTTLSAKMTILTGGNVGINSTGPGTKLEVKTDTNNDGITLEGSSSNLRFNIKNNSVTSGQRAFSMMMSGSYPALIFQGLNDSYGFTRNIMAIEHSGNVGIGTITPDDKLDVIDGNSQMVFGGASSDRAYIQFKHNAIPVDGEELAIMDFSGYNDASQNTRYVIITTKAEDVTDGSEDGSLSLLTMKAGTATNTMTLRSGNVGIGTDSPQMGLHVADTKGALFGPSGSGTSSAYFSPSDENTLNGSYGKDDDAGDIWLNYRGYQDGFTRFRDTRIGNGKGGLVAIFDGSTGNVGIGVTNPAQPLAVAKDAGGSAVAYFNSLNTNGYGVAIRTADTGNDKYVLRLDSNSGNTPVMYASNAGNVGIGTTAPGYKLEVKDSQDSSLFSGLVVERSANTTAVCLNAVGGALNLNTNSSMPIKFRIGNTSMQTINTDGGRAYAGFGGWRMFEYSYTVSVGNGATVDLFQNTSAHSDLHMVQIAIRMFHSGRTYYVGSGTVGGYGMNITGSGSGATNGGLTSAVVSSGIRKLQISQSSGYTAQATIYIQFRLDSGSGINVLNGTLSSL